MTKKTAGRVRKHVEKHQALAVIDRHLHEPSTLTSNQRFDHGDCHCPSENPTTIRPGTNTPAPPEYVAFPPEMMDDRTLKTAAAAVVRSEMVRRPSSRFLHVLPLMPTCVRRACSAVGIQEQWRNLEMAYEHLGSHDRRRGSLQRPIIIISGGKATVTPAAPAVLVLALNRRRVSLGHGRSPWS